MRAQRAEDLLFGVEPEEQILRFAQDDTIALRTPTRYAVPASNASAYSERSERLTAKRPTASAASALPQPSTLLDQLSNQSRPSCLMRRAEARAVVTMKVFVEWNEVAPIWIVVEPARAAEDRTAAFVHHEQADESS